MSNADLEYTLNKVRQELHIANILKIIELFEVKGDDCEQTASYADYIHHLMTTRLMQDGGF